MAEMTNTPGWAVLVKRVNDKMKVSKRRTLNGHDSSFEDYLKSTHVNIGRHDVLDEPEFAATLAAAELKRRSEEAV